MSDRTPGAGDSDQSCCSIVGRMIGLVMKSSKKGQSPHTRSGASVWLDGRKWREQRKKETIPRV